VVSKDFKEECEYYCSSKGKLPVDEAILLFKVCETIPRDELVADDEDLKTIFKLSGSCQKIFTVDNWKHPLSEELFGDDIRPSEFDSIKEMVKGVCKERLPRFEEEPNTDWRKIWVKRQ
jgi:hypothetical protein